MNTKILGVKGEQFAVDYLKLKNYNVIARNILYKNGELDIVALDGEVVVFIEVKARENEKFGTPLEAINSSKVKSMIQSAKLFIHQHHLYEREIRFDLITILRGEITHIKDAFWGN